MMEWCRRGTRVYTVLRTRKTDTPLRKHLTAVTVRFCLSTKQRWKGIALCITYCMVSDEHKIHTKNENRDKNCMTKNHTYALMQGPWTNGQLPYTYNTYCESDSPVASQLRFWVTSKTEFDVQVTVHHDKFLTIKPTRCTNFSNLFLEWNSARFGPFVCPSSAVFHCTHGNGICHTGLPTASEQEHMLLLTSCQQTCMTYTIAVCTAKYCWRWTDERSETCRVSFQK